ncbi:MAG: hypothetical protein AAFR75_12200, partial [Pseudomonadota bacterium]
HMFGDGGNDTITGGTGDDILVGGSGADTFVFDMDGSTDTVTDFNAGAGDVLQVSAPAGTTAADLIANAIQDGTTTVITLDATTTIRLDGVTIADLTPTDFWIV